MALKVLHLSTYAINGGAARAASALNRAMQNLDVNSRLVTAHGPRFALARTLDRQLWRLQRSSTQTWRSPARFASITANEINRSSVDIVNLHWITDGFLSVEEIGRIDKPIVWSMYDMWPFTGTEHYDSDTNSARWRSGYTRQNRPSDEQGFDLDRWTFERKEEHWPSLVKRMYMVPASSWLEEATRGSSLMRDWSITRAPHVVDTDVFAPMNMADARRSLGLPQEAPVVLFLASAGITDRRKGFDLLEESLREVASHHPDLQLAIAGPVTSDYRPPAGITLHWLGHLEGDDALRTAYCASDVLAAPSREDNMPLTAMEAQSCGRSVVAFNIGGLPDIVEHRTTGYLATPGDTADLATGLTSMLHDAREGNVAGILARARAQVTWSPAVIVHRYRTIYESVLT